MITTYQACEIKIVQQEATLALALAGDWVLDADTPLLEPLLKQMLKDSSINRLVFSTDALGRWDSLLMTDLIRIIDRGAHEGIEVDLSTLPEGIQGLLSLVYAVPERLDAKRHDTKRPWLELIGDGAISAVHEVSSLLTFVGEIGRAHV